MDYTSIAIVGKLNDLYENNDVFLSFPLGKIAFSHQSLDFLKQKSSTGASEIEKLNYRANFSRIVNMIPRDHVLFEMDASRFVWDEYQYALESANFAKSSLTTQEEKDLNEAIHFLGESKESSELKKYKFYRARFDVINRQYAQKKLSVELSTGVEGELLKKEWDTLLETELRDAKVRAEDEWINLGHKFKVEKYQSIRNSLEEKKYGNADKYLSDFRSSEFLDTNGVGASIYSTLYGPQNAFDPNVVWTEVVITSSEIQSYVDKATEEVKNLFSGEVSSDLNNLDSITLEYNNVSVIRPWFNSWFFEMRNWRLPENDIMSDGNIPRNGRLPAFISSMIMIKNVRYKYKSTPAQIDSEILSILGKRPLINVVKEIKNNFPKFEIPLGGQRGPLPDPPPDWDLRIPGRAFGDFPSLAGERPPIITNGNGGGDIPFLGGERPPIFTNGNGGGRIGEFNRPSERLDSISQPEMLEVNNVLTEEEKAESVNYSFDEAIYVIAFVCQRLPKSPNPNTNLTW